MSDQGLVSVITIFLNAEAYLEEAIASIFAQSYPAWELLLVDDGSTDGSMAIARRWAAQYPAKVRYLEHAGHQNRGMSASRNAGIAASRPEARYIAFLDADDVWFPFTLAHQVALLEGQPGAGMVYGTTRFWYSWTGNPVDGERDFLDFADGRGYPAHTLVQPPNLLTYWLNHTAAVPCMCSLLVRKEVMQTIGGFEATFRGLYEDQVFYAKVALQTPIYVTDSCLANYRQHSASHCAIAEKRAQVTSARLAYLNWLKTYVRTRQVEDEELARALRQAQWQQHYPRLHHWFTSILEYWKAYAGLIARRLRQILAYS